MTFEGAELEALEEGRNTVVIELNSSYVALAKQRLQTARRPLGFETQGEGIEELQLSLLESEQ